MGKYEDLKLLAELREKGNITEEEYQREKAKILCGTPPPLPPIAPQNESNDRLYVALMHLTQLVSWILIPLIMWVIAKDRSTFIDQNGKNVINFCLSYMIYIIAAALLSIMCIGIPILIALGIMLIVFVIIGTIKAANGEAWQYPLSIEFLK